MHHMYCTHSTHSKDNFIGVCLSNKCQISQKLLCGHCYMEGIHNEHQYDTMRLDDFCRLFDQGLKIIEERNQFFEALKQRVRDKYKELQQKMDCYQQRIMFIIQERCQEIKRFEQLFNSIQNSNSKVLCQQQIDEYLKQFTKHFEIDELINSSQQFKLRLSDEEGFKQAQFLNMCHSVKNIINNLVEQSQKIDKLIDDCKSEILRDKRIQVQPPQIKLIKQGTNRQIRQTNQQQDQNQQRRPIIVLQLNPHNSQSNNFQ